MNIQSKKDGAFQTGNASLYSRLGGLYPIARLVDDFIDRLVVNETLNANAAVVAARDPATRAGLKYHVAAFVAQAAGGPQIYTGRTMTETHAKLNITGREWRAMMAELASVLYKYNVPDAEQGEITALVAGLEDQIVSRPEA